jgi:hypothetical protein
VTIQPTALKAILLLSLAPAAVRAADVALPPPPAGMALQPDAGVRRAYKLAVLGGFVTEGDVASGSLQLDLARVATPASWKRVQLEWHLPVRVGRPQWDGTLLRTRGGVEDVAGTTKDTVWLFEAIPTARLILPVAPGFALHLEGGVGLSQTVETRVEDEIYVGRTQKTTLVLAPIVRGAVGLTYQLSDRLEAVLQPVALGRRAGTDTSSFSALWGLSYRL